jgi:Icc-related predicted phosphoesterase
MAQELTIHAISDTHTRHDRINLPGGDILIHAGDMTSQGELHGAIAFLNWFEEQDYSHLILIAGNHDFCFERTPQLLADECKSRGITLLNDSGVTVEGIKIWGSPVQPWFHDWAFNRHRGADIKKHWDLIPEDTELLITHGPPYGICDQVLYAGREQDRHVGCQDLLEKILKTQVKLHIFGHIHEAKGYTYKDGKVYVNASSLNARYELVKGNITKIVKDLDGVYQVED